MCGIVGFVSRTRDEALLARMLGPIAHRGPDGEGAVVLESGDGWFVHLGHRRLSIVDLEGGVQPMAIDDGLTITFNGEIWGYRELRASLLARGRALTTSSDTEVILHEVALAGDEAVARLNGMFAFAIWDARHRRLLLARDRWGIKPLVWASLPDGGVAFSSELRSLLVHPGIDRRISDDGLASFFFADYVQPPHTIVRGASRVPPGCTIAWKDGQIEGPRAFASLEELEPPAETDAHAVAAELWRRLDTAVSRQLVADVPVGIFLSGGLDSSSVARLARLHVGPRLQTFSIGFDDPEFDESSHARLVANALGTTHVEERIAESTLLDLVAEALDHLDEPLADPSILPTWLLSRLARQHVKVVLGGDGGDELLGGYPTYRAHRAARVYEAVPSALRHGLLERAIEALPPSDGYMALAWKAKRFALRWDDEPVRRHLRWMSSSDLPDVRAMMPSLGAAEPPTLALALPPYRDSLNRMMALDLATYLPSQVLAKVDRASMAHGLEVRPPMLDDDFARWARSVPSSFKVRGGTTKRLFRLAASRHLPKEIVALPKRGFAIPLSRWVRGPLRAHVEEALSPTGPWDDGLLDRATFRRFADEHAAARVDRSKPLWALVVLDRWTRRQRTLDASATHVSLSPSEERVGVRGD
ncbi:MAG: asparagine synthase (glutamine-hydrolyzing) [Deltaproteobacteria bacterium]|nr:asparagine synthase (glutamine-hydrolyzing) [Deltaproteobacteria bacterium]